MPGQKGGSKMFPFRKKKIEEPEKEEEVVKPVRKRKKKAEPSKPWGHKERFIIFIILIGTLASSLFFAFKSRNVMVGGNPYNINTLQEKLNSELNGKKDSYGIWIQALDNSYSLGINENEEFESNFFPKISLLIKYKEEVSKGNINPDALYTIKHVDTDLGEPGQTLTYDEIAGNFAKNFNNSAFSALAFLLNKNTEVKNTTTPADFGQLFYKNSSLLKNIDTKNFVSEDGEIVSGKKSYILIILSKSENLEEVQTEIPKIKNIVYELLGK
jgi:hypothetical protein